MLKGMDSDVNRIFYFGYLSPNTKIGADHATFENNYNSGLEVS
jgi:hypothetical protein